MLPRPLQLAVASVQEELVRLSIVPPRMRAFVADIEEGLEDFSVYMLSERKALFSLTGFTLGNSREDRLMDAISSAMRPGDVILVDCRLHAKGNSPSLRLPQQDVDQLMKPYSSSAINRFAFGPVQIASDFTISMDDVSFMKHVYPQRKSAVAGSINVMLECTDLYSTKAERAAFLHKMGFDPVADKMRLVRRAKPFELAMVTFYDFETLSIWFENRDMKIKWRKNVDDLLGIFLLEKK
jgi:hypothetical protein